MISTRRILKCVLALFYVHSTHAEYTTKDWHHKKILDENGMFQLYWTVEKNYINFQIEVATKGWIGFGLSPSGDIIGSDIVTGWVKDDKAFLYDYYANNSAKIILDKSQDLHAISGFENKTHTVLRFSRKLNTCDNRDWVITNDTQMVLFTSYPKDTKSAMDVPYSLTVWKLTLFKLLQPRRVKIAKPEEMSYWDLRADNFTLSSDTDTFYYCKIFRSPLLKRKHHIVKISEVIRPQNKPYIHHLCIYKCFPRSIQEGEEAVAFGSRNCYDPGLPSLFSTCLAIIFCWGLDGGDFVFPEHVGQPLGGNSVPEYWRLETHYDLSFSEGITDDSGLRYYYTPRLRKHDSSVTMIQAPILSPTATPTVIPPNQRGFIVASHAAPECLSQGMSSQGIKIFTTFLHSHTLGRKIRLRHFRRNMELPTIAEDFNYSHMHQEYTFFRRDVTILPGDHLVVECSMDSRSRSSTTLFGISTEGEMCSAFIFHYPPLEIPFTESNPPFELLAGLTGISLNPRNCNQTSNLQTRKPFGHFKGSVRTKMNESLQESTRNEFNCYIDYLIDYNWPSEDMCLIQTALRYSPQVVHCRTINGTYLDVPRATYPEDFVPYKYPRDQCKYTSEKHAVRQTRDMKSSCAE